MKVLMINKFLYPKGGAETYFLKLGEWLEAHGHEVQYFGMEHAGNCVGNRVNAYTSEVDFHDGSSALQKLSYPLRIINSKEAGIQITKVLNDFKPDVCHINNFNYQLTPSIIPAIKNWNPDCRIIYTAHDCQLICPNHMCNNPNTHENCEKCLGGHFINCVKGKCIHGSRARSVIGTIEAMYWNSNGVYNHFDKMICCSSFLKGKMDSNPTFAEKTVALHNFIDAVEWKDVKKEDYVLYFGRYSSEKGLDTLVEAAKSLPEINFVFAGSGPLEDIIKADNIRNVGFKTGADLEKVIREAKFSICPSEWYENCPFSVMESQMYGTPVLGANIGGIPELIQVGKTGELFESGNKEDLISKIQTMMKNCEEYSQNCKTLPFDTIDDYCEKLLLIYNGIN